MLIYNVTVQVEQEIAGEWLSWMQRVHIPEVLATGYFRAHRLLRLVDDRNDVQTFAVQYECESPEHLAAYQSRSAPALQAAHTERYKGRFVAFRTLLEPVPDVVDNGTNVPAEQP